MNVGEDGDQDDRLRPGHLRRAHGGEAWAAAPGGGLTGEAAGLQNGEGHPHPPPEPRGHRRKCGGTEAARPIPGRGPHGHGAVGRGGPGRSHVPPGWSGAAFPSAGTWEKGTWGQGPSRPLRALLCLFCACAANPGPPGSPQERRWGKKEQEAREGAQAKRQGH